MLGLRVCALVLVAGLVWRGLPLGAIADDPPNPPTDAARAHTNEFGPYALSVLRVVTFAPTSPRSWSVSAGNGVVTTLGVYTARHVVQDRPVIRVQGWDDKWYVVTGVENVEGADLARIYVEVPYPPLPVTTLSVAAPTRGRVVGYWGAGFNNGRPAIVTGDILPGGAPDHFVKTGNLRAFPSSIPVARGLSGSPVIVDGQVVAVVSTLVYTSGPSEYGGTYMAPILAP